PHRPSAPAAVDEEMPAFPFRRSASAAPAADSNVRVALRPVPETDTIGPATRPLSAIRPAEVRGAGEHGRLPSEAVRLLKATLFELGECRRLLDNARE